MTWLNYYSGLITVIHFQGRFQDSLRRKQQRHSPYCFFPLNTRSLKR